MLADLRGASKVVAPAGHLEICSDPDDNKFLECAAEAKAGYLVTGNARHFPAEWSKIRVVNAKSFLHTWSEHLAGQIQSEE